VNRSHLALAGRIRQDLAELERIVDRARHAWERAVATADACYVDSVALNLHSFYTACESIFEQVASSFDKAPVEGKNWHQELLRQMAAEIPLVRSAVISVESRKYLDELRGFRHVVRNIYAFNLNPAKIEPLVTNLPVVFARLTNEISTFLDGIETNGREDHA